MVPAGDVNTAGRSLLSAAADSKASAKNRCRNRTFLKTNQLNSQQSTATQPQKCSVASWDAKWHQMLKKEQAKQKLQQQLKSRLDEQRSQEEEHECTFRPGTHTVTLHMMNSKHKHEIYEQLKALAAQQAQIKGKYDEVNVLDEKVDELIRNDIQEDFRKYTDPESRMDIIEFYKSRRLEEICRLQNKRIDIITELIKLEKACSSILRENNLKLQHVKEFGYDPELVEKLKPCLLNEVTSAYSLRNFARTRRIFQDLQGYRGCYNRCLANNVTRNHMNSSDTSKTRKLRVVEATENNTLTKGAHVPSTEVLECQESLNLFAAIPANPQDVATFGNDSAVAPQRLFASHPNRQTIQNISHINFEPGANTLQPSSVAEYSNRLNLTPFQHPKRRYGLNFLLPNEQGRGLPHIENSTFYQSIASPPSSQCSGPEKYAKPLKTFNRYPSFPTESIGKRQAFTNQIAQPNPFWRNAVINTQHDQPPLTPMKNRFYNMHAVSSGAPLPLAKMPPFFRNVPPFASGTTPLSTNATPNSYFPQNFNLCQKQEYSKALNENHQEKVESSSIASKPAISGLSNVDRYVAMLLL